MLLTSLLSFRVSNFGIFPTFFACAITSEEGLFCEVRCCYIRCAGLYVLLISSPHRHPLQELPPDNLRVLNFVVQLMNDVALHADENKMTRSNLAIVFGPNLLWPREEQVCIVCTRLSDRFWFAVHCFV